MNALRKDLRIAEYEYRHPVRVVTKIVRITQSFPKYLMWCARVAWFGFGVVSGIYVAFWLFAPMELLP